MDQSLLSFEKLDRASPDLWPEQSLYMFHRNMFQYNICLTFLFTSNETISI